MNYFHSTQGKVQSTTTKDIIGAASKERQLTLHKKSPGSTSSLSTASGIVPRHIKRCVARINSCAIRAMLFFFVPVLAFRDGKNAIR
jgi:hypothetical protein